MIVSGEDYSKECRVLLIGLDGSGKTTFLSKMKHFNVNSFYFN